MNDNLAIYIAKMFNFRYISILRKNPRVESYSPAVHFTKAVIDKNGYSALDSQLSMKINDISHCAIVSVCSDLQVKWACDIVRNAS